MMMLMHHIVGFVNLIDMLRVGAHDPTTSSSLTSHPHLLLYHMALHLLLLLLFLHMCHKLLMLWTL
jgi:hypothetical protein